MEERKLRRRVRSGKGGARTCGLQALGTELGLAQISSPGLHLPPPGFLPPEPAV